MAKKVTTIKTGSSQQAYRGVKITDFNTGESVRTDTTNGVVVRRTYSGGGGSGRAQQLIDATRAQEEANRQAEVRARFEAQQKAQEDALRIQQEQAKLEQQKIENLRRAILEKGAQERERISRNAANERIRTTTTEIQRIQNGKSTNASVWKYENLDTGEVRYRSYEVPKGGGGRVLSGGVDVQLQTKQESSNIQNELRDAGLKPIVKDGQVIGFSSQDTQQSYVYNDRGIRAFNVAIERMSNIETGKKGRFTGILTKADETINKGATAVKNTVSNLLRRTGINVKDTRVANYVSKVAVQLKNKGIDNINKYRTYVENRRDEALRNMRSAKPNLKQPKTLTQINKWIRSFDRYVANRAILTALDIGVATPQLVNQLRQAPFATIAVLPGAILEGFKQDFRTIKSGDLLGITNLATDYLVYTAAFGLASKGVKATTRGIMQVLPGTRRVVKGAIKIKPGLSLKLQTVKSGAKPLSFQARMAGKKVTAVTAQADQLTSLLRRKKIIRKPIPGEEIFPIRVKRTLAKFDAGKRLTNKEFANVNMWLRKNVAPNITLLERSLYLDPASGLRISRLGIQTPRTATLRDVLRGNFTLWQKQGRPQILVFENAKIARFPKALRTIERKLKAGKTLTTAETNRLIRWQVQTGSGRFKPIGSTIYAGGKELEITLAPGELIKRVKSLGRVFIDGRKVTIVSAEVFKPSRAILKQMKLAELGKLSKSAVNKLNNFLSKKLGRKVKVHTADILVKTSRQIFGADRNVPILRVRGSGIFVRSGMRGSVARPSLRTPLRVGGRVTGRTVRGGRVVGRVARPGGRVGRTGRITRVTPRGRIVRGRARITRTSRPIRRTGRIGRGGRRSPPRTPKTPVIRLPGFRPQQLSKAIPTFYVVEKVRGKFKKLYPKPLTLRDARDYAVYSIDNNLSRTAFFIPLGRAKRVVRPPKPIQNYASKNRFKVRPYRIRFGKRRQLVNGFIEKRKYFQDTPGEKRSLRSLRRTPQRQIPRRRMSIERRKQLIRQLQKARAIRMRQMGTRVRPSGIRVVRPVRRMVRPVRRSRRISPNQRRELLRRLKKARAIRMRMLRRRR